jgi:hypothetical protein
MTIPSIGGTPPKADFSKRPVMRRVFIRTFDCGEPPTQEWLDGKLNELYAETGVQGAVFNTVVLVPLLRPLPPVGGFVSGIVTEPVNVYRAIFTIWT